jgi:hypothetical protein
VILSLALCHAHVLQRTQDWLYEQSQACFKAQGKVFQYLEMVNDHRNA